MVFGVAGVGVVVDFYAWGTHVQGPWDVAADAVPLNGCLTAGALANHALALRMEADGFLVAVPSPAQTVVVVGGLHVLCRGLLVVCAADSLA